MNFTFFTKGLRVREEEVKYYLKVTNKNTADILQIREHAESHPFIFGRASSMDYLLDYHDC